eukprot:g2017.t1
MAEPRQAGTKPEEEQQTKADDEKKRRRKAEKGELKAEPGQHVVLVLGGALLLGLAALSAFFAHVYNAPRWDFISWDDPQNYGPGNRFLERLSWAQLADIVLDGVVLAVYEPVSLTFKLLAKEIIGLSARKVVLTSCVLHSINAIVA